MPDTSGDGIMSTQEMRATNECPEWCLDSANIAELIEWLVEADELSPADDFSEILYMLRKPWKWVEEWKRMRIEKDEAEKTAREERSRR